MNCPICKQRVTKKNLMAMDEVEYLKMQLAFWMMAWNAERNKVLPNGPGTRQANDTLMWIAGVAKLRKPATTRLRMILEKIGTL